MAKYISNFTGAEIDQRLFEVGNIKRELQEKYAVIRMSETINENNYYSLELFHSKEDEEAYDEDPEHNQDKITVVPIPISAVQGDAYTARLSTTISNMVDVVVTEDNFFVPLNYRAIKVTPIGNENAGALGTLTIQRSTDGGTTWTEVGVIANALASSDPEDTTTTQDINIGPYLANGKQNVRIRATFEYVNEEGDSKTVSSAWVAIGTSVIKTSLSLIFANDWWKPITTASITPSYYINGSIAKTLNLKIDGVRTITSYIGETTYVDTPFGNITITDSETESNPVCTQGIHTIEAWLSVETHEGTLEGEHVTSQVLIILDASTAEEYVILNDIKTDIVNWTDETLFTYAVYNPNGNTLPLSFVLSDYNGTTTYATYEIGNVVAGAKHTFATMFEIESDLTEFGLRMHINSEETTKETLMLSVDNSQNFAPTKGADFILNPKLRSNQEEGRNTIINAVNGETIEAEFNGFGFVNDGWVTDDEGNKCLRMLAGDFLYIKGYEAFSDFLGNNNTSSLTMEFDVAVRNVTNETEPILRMCSYNNNIPVGWEMLPLQAMFGTLGLQVRLDQDVAWAENTRTHVAVNIVYNLANSGLNYIRIYVNGIINREMSYLTTDTFVQYNEEGVKSSGGIRIGASQAEIDIYGIRIYKKALSSSDVMKDYEASLPTSALKLAFRAANDVLNNGIISYEYAKVKYNTLLWKYNAKQPETRLATYGDQKKQLQYGDLVVNIVGDDKHSGTMYGVNTQGQGTSSMSYWKWNQRFQFDDGGYFVNNLGETFPTERWQLMDGMPYSYRNDAKLNWASSMQSHKIGATALFNDCWKKVIGTNTIVETEGGQDFTHTEGGYSDCRVAVRQLPFMMFVQPRDGSEPEFYGLYTMGPGKGDKPTFGYDKDTFPDYTMLEGCDNNKALVMHRVPWDNAITGSQEDEVWSYNDEESWEISIGSGNLWEEFKDTFNFVYLHHTDILPYIGTLTSLQADPTVDQSKDYWVATQDSTASKYDLFRYDIIDKAWVPCGMNKTTLNLATQCAAHYTPSGVDYNAINQSFINARIAMFKEQASAHIAVDDFLFCMMFLRLFAATDNRGKNTYLYKVKAGDPIRCFQDDLDSIMLTDNVGRKTKPYWIEEHDVNGNNQPYWNSSRNALYNLLEQAYPDDCKAMMASILTAMNELGGGTLNGCLQKYFYDVQEGFPAVAYNEIARLLYEDAARAFANGEYTTNTPPLPQCLGDQLQSEKEWNKKRMVYMSSYSSFGEFASGEVAGALAFRSILTTTGASPKYTFAVVPHIWIYPANGTGNSVFPSGVRVQAGESFTFPERTSDGNTNVRIHGINYYRQIGNFGDKSVGEAFALSGERLTEFVASATIPEFRITSISVSARNLEKLDLTGISTLGGGVDLTKQQRLREILLSGTSVTSVTLPDTDALVTLTLPATLTSLRIENQPNLQSVTIDGTDTLQEVYVDHTKASAFDSKALVDSLYASSLSTGNRPSALTLLGVDWNGLSASVLEWLVEIPNITLTGTISIAEGGTAPAITWDMKNKINRVFGNVDNPNSADYKGLLLNYRQRQFNAALATIRGNFYPESGDTFQFEVRPSSRYENTQTSITYGITGGGDYTMDRATGILTVNSLSDTKHTATVSASVNSRYEGADTTTQHTKNIELWNRPAQLGDLVYYDGTYSSVASYDREKTPIGVCFYVAPRNTDGSLNTTFNVEGDTQLRLMVALEDVKTIDTTSSLAIWQWGAYHSTGDNPADLSNSLYDISGSTGALVNLTSNAVTSIYDIPTIINLSERGINSAYIDVSVDENSDYRDLSSEEGLANDGFKCITPNYVFGDGFAYKEAAEHTHMTTARTLTASLAALAGNDYKEGDIVNSGYIKMLKIIEHRNTVLANDIIGADNEIFLEAGTFAHPVGTSSMTELQSLVALMESMRTWATNDLQDTYPNKWSQLAFPAASACYAYQPSVGSNETLADRFTAHNWWLPTEGQLARLCWYTKYGDLYGQNVFADAKAAGVLSFSSSSYHWSSTENTSSSGWNVYFYSGGTDYYLSKFNSSVVRAVSAF